jgi:hypothetical protein
VRRRDHAGLLLPRVATPSTGGEAPRS